MHILTRQLQCNAVHITLVARLESLKRSTGKIADPE